MARQRDESRRIASHGDVGEWTEHCRGSLSQSEWRQRTGYMGSRRSCRSVHHMQVSERALHMDHHVTMMHTLATSDGRELPCSSEEIPMTEVSHRIQRVFRLVCV